jgi:hypothetical protein
MSNGCVSGAGSTPGGSAARGLVLCYKITANKFPMQNRMLPRFYPLIHLRYPLCYKISA